MKNFRLLVILMAMSVSGWVHADTQPMSLESMNIASVINVNSVLASASSHVNDSFSANSGVSLSRDLNFIQAGGSDYFQSRRQSHVPEPEGWSMMLMGVGFVVYQIRRRKNSRRSGDLG